MAGIPGTKDYTNEFAMPAEQDPETLKNEWSSMTNQALSDIITGVKNLPEDILQAPLIASNLLTELFRQGAGAIYGLATSPDLSPEDVNTRQKNLSDMLGFQLSKRGQEAYGGLFKLPGIAMEETSKATGKVGTAVSEGLGLSPENKALVETISTITPTGLSMILGAYKPMVNVAKGAGKFTMDQALNQMKKDIIHENLPPELVQAMENSPELAQAVEAVRGFYDRLKGPQKEITKDTKLAIELQDTGYVRGHHSPSTNKITLIVGKDLKGKPKTAIVDMADIASIHELKHLEEADPKVLDTLLEVYDNAPAKIKNTLDKAVSPQTKSFLKAKYPKNYVDLMRRLKAGEYRSYSVEAYNLAQRINRAAETGEEFIPHGTSIGNAILEMAIDDPAVAKQMATLYTSQVQSVADTLSNMKKMQDANSMFATTPGLEVLYEQAVAKKLAKSGYTNEQIAQIIQDAKTRPDRLTPQGLKAEPQIKEVIPEPSTSYVSPPSPKPIQEPGIITPEQLLKEAEAEKLSKYIDNADLRRRFKEAYLKQKAPEITQESQMIKPTTENTAFSQRAKDYFDRTFFEYEKSPDFGKEIKYGDSVGYLTGRPPIEHAGIKWYKAFFPWDDKDYAFILQDAKKNKRTVDPGNLGQIRAVPEHGLKETGNNIVGKPKEVIQESQGVKPVKTEGHHELPISGKGASKGDKLAWDRINWQLNNLGEGGWKTVKDIPKEEHAAITKKQVSKPETVLKKYPLPKSPKETMVALEEINKNKEWLDTRTASRADIKAIREEGLDVDLTNPFLEEPITPAARKRMANNLKRMADSSWMPEGARKLAQVELDKITDWTSPDTNRFLEFAAERLHQGTRQASKILSDHGMNTWKGTFEKVYKDWYRKNNIYNREDLE